MLRISGNGGHNQKYLVKQLLVTSNTDFMWKFTSICRNITQENLYFSLIRTSFLLLVIYIMYVSTIKKKQLKLKWNNSCASHYVKDFTWLNDINHEATSWGGSVLILWAEEAEDIKINHMVTFLRSTEILELGWHLNLGL